MVSNVMLLITVGCVCVLGVGGGVWETLHSARGMNSAAPGSVLLQFPATEIQLKIQKNPLSQVKQAGRGNGGDILDVVERLNEFGSDTRSSLGHSKSC